MKRFVAGITLFLTSIFPAGAQVGSRTAGQVGGYVATGNAITGLPKLWQVDETMTLAQINAVFAAADSNSTVLVGNNVPTWYSWSNPNGAQARDFRVFAHPLEFAKYGIACDFTASILNLTITQGSNQVVLRFSPLSR